MENLNDFMERVSSKTGFTREVYSDVRSDEALVIPLFADRRHEFALSVFLHSKLKKDRYLIIAGIPGRGGLFGNADEYWGLSNVNICSDVSNAVGWEAKSDRLDYVERQLNRYVETFSGLEDFYKFGFKSKFFEEFKFVVNDLPGIPQIKTEYAGKMGNNPVVVIPNKSVIAYRRGEFVRLIVNRKLYISLVERLVSEGYNPIILQNYGTYDISPNVSGCSVFSNLKALDELSIVRSSVLVDLFAADSRLSLMARSPYLVVAERQTYEMCKDYEVEDLVGSQIPSSHIFSFATMIEGNEYGNIIDGIIVKLSSLSLVDRNELPSTLPKSSVAPYMLVRERKAKKFGNRLFKINKID